MKHLLLFIATNFFLFSNTGAQHMSSDTIRSNNEINSASYIDSLGMNDTLLINFASRGCFHNLSRKIKIIRSKQHYELILYNEKGYTSFEGKSMQPKKEPTKYLRLTLSQIDELRRFQQQAIFYDCQTACGCTTEDKYEFIFKHSVKTYSDSDCHWKGFKKLIKSLFNQPGRL